MSLPKTCDFTEKEVYISNEQKQKIFGIQYVPKIKGKKKFPFVIITHGLGATHYGMISYARDLARHGIASYNFDFRGGCHYSRSDGSTLDMSVYTEADDVITAYNVAKTWDFVDTNQIYLLGESQGGLVCSIAGITLQDKIRGLILLYPAYVATDDVRQRYKTVENIPEKLNYFGWIYVSKKYLETNFKLDIYTLIKDFIKPVIIIHGDRDGIVPVSYAERAQKAFKNAKLFVLKGEGHGFMFEGFDKAMNLIYSFLKENKAF